MKTITVKNHTVKLYDSIDEMPIVNFQKYNKLILIDSGLGSDIDSVDAHLVNLAKLIKTDRTKASQELQNLRHNMHFIVSGISPKYLAFAALIHSIDDEKVTDLSDDNLKSLLNKLSEIKHSKLIKILNWLKKKLDAELNMYFPTSFGSNAKEKEVYDKLKHRTILVLNGLLENTDNTEEINAINSYLFGMYKPKNFDGPNSIEIKYDKQFETMCLLMSQKANLNNAKSMTVLEFYTAFENISKQIEAENKAYKRVKH